MKVLQFIRRIFGQKILTQRLVLASDRPFNQNNRQAVCADLHRECVLRKTCTSTKTFECTRISIWVGRRDQGAHWTQHQNFVHPHVRILWPSRMWNHLWAWTVVIYTTDRNLCTTFSCHWNLRKATFTPVSDQVGARDRLSCVVLVKSSTASGYLVARARLK